MRKLLISLSMCSMLAGSPAASQGIPTIDISAIAQIKLVITEAKLQLKQLIAQNIKLDDQTLKLIQQLKQLKALYDQLSRGLTLADLGIGPNFLNDILPGYADLTNSFNAAKMGNWSGALTSATVAGQSVDSYVSDLFQNAGLQKSTVDTLSQSTDPAVARIGNAANSSAFMSVAAQAATEDATKSLTILEQLATKAGQTTTLKEAMDLNTRVLIQIAIAATHQIQLEAVQTIGMGEMGVMDAATAAEEEIYLKLLP